MESAQVPVLEYCEYGLGTPSVAVLNFRNAWSVGSFVQQILDSPEESKRHLDYLRAFAEDVGRRAHG